MNHKNSNPEIYLVLALVAIVALWLLNIPVLQEIRPLLFLIAPFLVISNIVLKFTDKPGKKVGLFYGGFAVIIGGGILVASLSLNSAFFLFPCLIGIPMIFFSMTIKKITPAEKVEG